MARLSVAEARREFAEVINRAAYTGERTVISRHGQPVAAVISIRDLHLLDALLERYESERDVEEARTAMLEAHEERIAWDQIKRDFEL